jgi:transposase
LAHRVSAPLLESILTAFNAGGMDAQSAAERLQIGRSQLYALRSQWLRAGQKLGPKPSGGSRSEPWPAQVLDFMRDFLPHSRPANFALLADEIDRRFSFTRSRAAVASAARHHFPLLVSAPPRGPKPRRRWQCAAIGELFQHDSSPHRWWKAEKMQSLIITLDDHSRKILGGLFVPADTTWDHFRLLREVFLTHGLPASFYTDGLSLFGHTSTSDRLDTCSQFQRALTALGVAHRVAPDAQAKGKVERRFGYFQNRLVALFAHEQVASYPHANLLLAEQIHYYNASHVCRTTAMTPNAAWEKALAEKRCLTQPAPAPTLLDLHLALHLQRRLNADFTIDFLGSVYPVTPSKRKSVTIVHHPERRFWVIASPPQKNHPVWPDILASYSL